MSLGKGIRDGKRKEMMRCKIYESGIPANKVINFRPDGVRFKWHINATYWRTETLLCSIFRLRRLSKKKFEDLHTFQRKIMRIFLPNRQEIAVFPSPKKTSAIPNSIKNHFPTSLSHPLKQCTSSSISFELCKVQNCDTQSIQRTWLSLKKIANDPFLIKWTEKRARNMDK